MSRRLLDLCERGQTQKRMDIDAPDPLQLGLATLLAVSLLTAGFVGYDYQQSQADSTVSSIDFDTQEALPVDERAQIAPPADGITVIGAHPGQRLIAFAPDGRLLYHNDTLDRYHDVDPAPNGSTTVEFVGAEYLSADECAAEMRCTRNLIQRVNLTTGETEELYSHTTPRRDGYTHRWHDVDRINSSRVVVADIHRDAVFIVNTETGEKTYEWSAQSDYPISGGGDWPSDWTHLNDVEYLDDGRIMVSLRNQDSVVFIRPGEGVLDNQTLGSDDDYSTLYEQHNPDYIPEERGGPAVVVADSQNDRLVEYQRVDGEWEQSWQWQDDQMAWPRDADRLPNGNTLVADSNSYRVFEVNPEGDVVWEVSGITSYEVERLGTGDESAGGHSAQQLGLDSRTASESGGGSDGLASSVTGTLKGVAPSKIVNAVRFVTPAWMSIWSVLAVGVNVCAIGIGGVVGWRRSQLAIRSPIDSE